MKRSRHADEPSVLVVHAREFPPRALVSLRTHLGARELVLLAHALSDEAMASDRAALAELRPVLARLAEPRGVVGIDRGGTLAFLLGCTQRVAAVVDVDGPLLHPELSSARPIQPLELALNFEGAFLGLFGSPGPVGVEERRILAARLTAAARPHEFVEHTVGEALFDPSRPGYDERRADEHWARVSAFLAEFLAPDPD